jgi:hypothetical protein
MTIEGCPNCGGVADNGFDRCMPPSPYFCTKCQHKGEKFMTIDECIAVLTAHNKWRRGSDEMPQDSPATLGLAIDYAIEELHRLKGLEK